MNDMAFGIEWALESSGGLRGCDVDGLNHELRRTLQNDDGRYAMPMELVAER